MATESDVSDGAQFCGYAVVGDRGGPSEACGTLLPCTYHPNTADRDHRFAEAVRELLYEHRRREIALTLEMNYPQPRPLFATMLELERTIYSTPCMASASNASAQEEGK